MQTLDSTAAAVARNPRRWLVLAVLCLSSLVLVIDNMVLTVAIPQISTSLHAGAQQIQWVIDAYLLVFAGLLLTSGSLSDRFGRRLVMIIGLVLFGAASLLAAYAGSPELLIASRAAMAVGGVLILPSTLSILITVFDEQERPRRSPPGPRCRCSACAGLVRNRRICRRVGPCPARMHRCRTVCPRGENTQFGNEAARLPAEFLAWRSPVATQPNRSDRTPWNWLLLVPVVVPLLTFLFNFDKPRIAGFPMFYWLQILFILLSVSTTSFVYWVGKKRGGK